MIEEFEYKGKWWLSSMPEKPIFGTLKFNQKDGAVLDLTGSVKAIRNNNKMLKPDIVLGKSADGQDITLHECYEIGFQIDGYPDVETCSLCANQVFTGTHFRQPEDIRFKGIAVDFSYLDRWVGIPKIKRTFSKTKEFIIKCDPPKSIQANIMDDYRISIHFGAHISDRLHEISIKQKAYMTVETSEEKPFEEYWEIIHHIKKFLSLAMMEPVYPLSIGGMTEANKITVDIFYKLPEIPNVSKILMPLDMLFSFRDISAQFESYIKGWFTKKEQLKTVYNLYFGSLYNPRMYLEYQFLSLVQAIEAYHRQTMARPELPKEEYQKRKTEILELIPSEWKEWLQYKLGRNEPSLHKRFQDILETYSDLVNEFIGGKESFIKEVCTTRNCLIHSDEKPEKKPVKGRKLYSLKQKLKILLEICLLKELGFTSDKIKTLISRNMKYRHDR